MMNDKKYALIDSDGIVKNIVLWDGNGDIFPGYQTVELTDGVLCSIGWLYSDGEFKNTDTTGPSSQELYQHELSSMASVYNSDIMKLSDQYAKAALIDGVNEDTKKAAIYAEYQARKVRYQADLADLKVKYGV